MSEKSEKQEALELPSNNNSNKDQSNISKRELRSKKCFVCGKSHFPFCKPQWTGQSKKKKSGKKETTERQVNKSLYDQVQKLQGEIDAIREEEKVSSEEEENLKAIEEAEKEAEYQAFLEERYDHIKRYNKSWIEPHNLDGLVKVIPTALAVAGVVASTQIPTVRETAKNLASTLTTMVTANKSQGLGSLLSSVFGVGSVATALGSTLSSAWSSINQTKEVLSGLKTRDTRHTLKFVKFADYRHQDLRPDENSVGDLKHDDPHYAVFTYTKTLNYDDAPIIEQKHIVVSLELAAQARRTAKPTYTADMSTIWLGFERACSTNTTVNVSAYCEERSNGYINWDVRHNTAFFLLCDHKWNIAHAPEMDFLRPRSHV